jgi:hypothetical protein
METLKYLDKYYLNTAGLLCVGITMTGVGSPPHCPHHRAADSVVAAELKIFTGYGFVDST